MKHETYNEQENTVDQALAKTPDGKYLLRLYITGTTPRSSRAIENLRRFCETHLQGRYTLEVIDIYQHPEAARDQQIIAAPTLIKLLPNPLRRIIGDLSQTENIFYGLDLIPRSGSPE
jgi:circadian clock protein KaiB